MPTANFVAIGQSITTRAISTNIGIESMIYEKSENLKKYLYHIIDALDFQERILRLPNCNTCKKRINSCVHVPEVGDNTRINCPHWEAES